MKLDSFLQLVTSDDSKESGSGDTANELVCNSVSVPVPVPVPVQPLTHLTISAPASPKNDIGSRTA